MRRRAMSLALIALVVPFPALALDGGGVTGSGPAGLSVSASLDSCGLAGSQIMCKINAGWNSVEGAESYTVSVTSADGSVVDYGETSGQGTAVWVPYVGAGTYSVSVTAWGTPPQAEEPEVIARDSSEENDLGSVSREAPEDAPGDSRDLDGAGPVSEDPPVLEEPVDPEPEPPACEEPPVEEPPPAPPADPEGDSRERDAAYAAEAAAAEPEVVDTIPVDDDCPG